ncbi:MAG: alpha/beta hydrolase [Methylotenera sp.]|nr:alpha/beta hydrolase [Methylotenera sp.]
MHITPPITLVLLPGMDGTGDLFAPLVNALPSTVKTVIVRYPTEKIMSYGELTTYALAYIPKNSPYILLGESFSGPIAISLAAQADYQLKGLILACTFASNPRPLLSKLSFLVPAMPINKWLFPSACKVLMGKFYDNNVRSLLAATLSKVPPKTMRARLDSVINVDYSEKLKNIQAPILYLQARHDYLVPASAAKLIQQCAKNVELFTLEAPHLLLQVAAKEAALHIQTFIKKTL